MRKYAEIHIVSFFLMRLRKPIRMCSIFLLQVLDDGHITDAHGRKVDFKQTIIIMTSNAGAQAIIEPKQLGFISQK